MVYDVVIIGSGPAGYTAALYTSRAFLKTLILSGKEPGGQLTTTTEIENFPGFPKGITGPQLMADMKTQVERFGTNVVNDVISNIKYTNTTNTPINKKTFLLHGQEKQYESKTVIIATGASAQYLGLPSEEKLRGKGVSACATCDGFFFRGKEVVVVGGGDTAMEEANFLTTFATKVTIIHRRSEFRASPIMLARAKKNQKISFITNVVIEEIVGNTKVTGVRWKDSKTGRQEELKTDGVFLAIGHKPSTEFLQGFVELDKKGYVVVNKTATSVPGVFAAGDCVDFQYRQAVVAAGMGAMAALDAQKYI